MDTIAHSTAAQQHGWYAPEDCRLEDLVAVVQQETDPADYPYADAVEQGVLVYGDRLRAAPVGERRRVQAELVRALTDGPGLAVFRGAFADLSVVDAVTRSFEQIVEEERRRGGAQGDHFAAPGANDRVWGALDKLARREPELFARYYGNDVLALVCEAWLGPGYQLTSQVNVVRPGGKAQVAHRDYHLGFMSLEQSSAYPAHVHRLSPALTLQGAVAHCDMPVETGPTLYLPHSQKYGPGYLAFHRPEVTAWFDEHHVQLPLRKGDAAFFNPALLHGAGTNRTGDVRRTANLLQVSSAFGRAMEHVDRTAVCRVVFPVLTRWRADGVDDATLRRVVAASAEGYAFPTSLDHDQPVGGRAPETQAELLWRALSEGWPEEALAEELDAQDARRTGGGRA